jgi:NADPH:quinone reductase-like Zn-dependent oxidoreductase
MCIYTSGKSLGAGEGINYARTSEWEKEVLKLTAQAGVDHILEVAGGKSLAQSIAAIKPGGQIAVIGILENFSSDFPIFFVVVETGHSERNLRWPETRARRYDAKV